MYDFEAYDFFIPLCNVYNVRNHSEFGITPHIEIWKTEVPPAGREENKTYGAKSE